MQIALFCCFVKQYILKNKGNIVLAHTDKATA
jgi:hypothetical protein